LRKKARIDLQLHARAENPNEILESRILPLVGVVLDVGVDVGDDGVVESACSVQSPDEVSLEHGDAVVVQ